MKTLAVCAGLLSTLLVLLWPMVLLLSGFLFDAPLHGAAETRRWVATYAILSYPIGYLLALGHVIFSQARKTVPWWAPPAGFLFLIPVAHFFFAVLFVAAVIG
jgi:hypothetical protein